MRTNEEFKAEVYRRGSEKLKKKKLIHKKLITTMSVGAVAACCVLVVWAFSPMLIENDEGSENKKADSNKNFYYDMVKGEESVDNSKGNSFIESLEQSASIPKETMDTTNNTVMTIETKSPDGVDVICNITDMDNIKEFTDFVAKLDKEGLKNDECDTSSESDIKKEYSYIIKLKNGNKIEEYVLEDNVITVLDIKEKYRLNNEQLETLLDIIN